MGENKKIAINSGILYLRLIITTVIGLYTSRIILLQLGAKDYGLYAVVGGVISMMNFLNTTMLATTYRYLAVEIGKGEKGNPNRIFNTSLVIHLSLTVVLVIIAETLGVWYIHNYLNVAPEKIPDALFVLHATVIATIFTIVSIPFQGLITAQEKFIVRAGIETIRAILKLGLIFLLIYYTGNKLRAYSIIMIFVMAVPPVLYWLYSQAKAEILQISLSERLWGLLLELLKLIIELFDQVDEDELMEKIFEDEKTYARIEKLLEAA